MITEKYYTTRNYELDHSTYSGRIYNYDFEAHTTISDVADRIISDWRFDEECRKNLCNKRRKQNGK